MHSTPQDNAKDLDLLRNNPPALVVAYQGMIRIIVQKFAASGMFAQEDVEDVMQTVSERLLAKLPVIQKQYNGSSLLKTYVSAIIRNICLKLHEKDHRVGKHSSRTEAASSNPPDFSDIYLIEHVVALFQAILEQYNNDNQLPKLLLCLKLRYRISLRAGDILRWYPDCNDRDLKGLVRTFGEDFRHMHERDIYNAITPALNKAERRSNSPDAIRKWMRARIGEILELLNGRPPRATFTEESLEILVEDYFSPFLRNRG